MIKETTIKLKSTVKKELDRLKIHPNQSYSEIIKQIIEERNGTKS